MSTYYVNGSYLNKADALISVEDRGLNFSDGVYEVIAFNKKKLLNLNKHIFRLKKSLGGISIKIPFSNFKSLELIILHLIDLNHLNKGFIYLQITRGSAKRNHLFPKKVKPNVIIFAFSNKNLDNLSKGVKVGTSEDIRWLRCDLKSISLLPNLLEKQKANDKGLYEIWQKRDSLITEGSTSNAFIVNSNNTILTHPKNNLILGGVTRDCIVSLAKKNKFLLEEKAFSMNEIKKCKEAFLTSTTVGVLPVLKIDSVIINNKKIGEITKKIINLYNQFLINQIK